jgi:hypothetical protein
MEHNPAQSNVPNLQQKIVKNSLIFFNTETKLRHSRENLIKFFTKENFYRTIKTLRVCVDEAERMLMFIYGSGRLTSIFSCLSSVKKKSLR